MRFAAVVLVGSLVLVAWGGDGGPKVVKARSLPGWIVVAAVGAALDAARGDGHLAACGAVFDKIADHRCLP